MYDKNDLQRYIDTHLIVLPEPVCAAALDETPKRPEKLSQKKRTLFFAFERKAGPFRPNAPKNAESDAIRPETIDSFQADICEEAFVGNASLPPSVPSFGAAPGAFTLDESFRDALLRIIDEKGYRDPEVYKRAGMDRRHFGKIKNDFENKYRPSKKTALALAIGLGLDLPETEDFIRRAGYSLSRSILSDVIVSYFLENGVTDIDTINEALYDADQPTLTE